MITLEALQTLVDEGDPPPSKGRVIAFGAPLDENSSHMPGAAEGAAVIGAGLFPDSGNSWTEGGVDLAAPGRFNYAGELELGDDDRLGKIGKAMTAILAGGAVPIIVGGDHSISAPAIKAVAARHEGLSVLHIDAHPDLYDDFEGNPNSHASPFARVMEAGVVKRLVQVGIRTLNAHQRDQIERFGVEVIEMKDYSGTEQVTLDGPIYVSIDLDGLDPAFAPGVSHPEPGGLSSRQVLDLIHSIGGALGGVRGGTLVGADVVEYNPRRDLGGMTAAVAAKLVRELAGVAL